ncbi:hypothetical protein AB0H83_24510 [Dactylosporangium sp. NPDC050688]|uniref:WD40 repeat domain-containing protein n=1 Tax=Dactylosporangium sp. NPDC050688 TaxID=3157217 RepID=UPI00340B255A
MRVRRALMVLCTVLVAGGIWLMTAGPEVSARLVNNAAVVGTVIGIAALFAGIAALPRSHDREAGVLTLPAVLSAEQEREAVDQIAREMSWVWRQQAQLRGLRQVAAPVVVRWRWASLDVAAPPEDFRRDAPGLRTEGTAGELGAGLYQPLPADIRIVVLGQPGAGKTGALLTLLLDALAARQADRAQPVPVLLSLGGWDPATPLLQWAATTIARDYGTAVRGTGPVRVMAELLRRERIALFLDGLDELPERSRGAALRAIDDQAVGLRVVLTSRPDEYAAALDDGQLGAAAVVELLPTDPASVEGFLVTGRIGPRRAAWQAVATYLRDHPGSVAATALNTPLALALARQTYAADGDPTELIAEDRFPDERALLRHLIGRFVDQAYPDRDARDDALFWLSWIARRVDRHPDVAWWRIPQWLRNRGHGVFYGLAAGLAAGLLVTVITAALDWPGRTVPLTAAVNTGLLVGLVVAVTAGSAVTAVVSDPRLLRMPAAGPPRGAPDPPPRQAAPVHGPRVFVAQRPGLHTFTAIGDALGDAARVAWTVAWILALTAAIGFAFAGFGQGVVNAVMYGVAAGVVALPAAFVATVLAATVVNLSTRSLTDSSATTPDHSYAGDRAVNAVYATLVVAAGATLTAGLLAAGWLGHLPGLDWLGLDGRFVTWLLLTVGVGGGVTAALAMGLATRAVPALKFAELVLWLRHGRRPHFRSLLDTALDRQVVRQAGAVYQFRHATIRDYLAGLRVEPVRWLELRWLRPAVLWTVAVALAAAVVASAIAVRGKPFLALPGFVDEVTALAVAPDGTIAAGGDDGAVRIVDATGATVRTLTGHTGRVISIAFAGDGATLASRGRDGTARIWDAATGGALRTLTVADPDSNGRLVYSPDSRLLAVTGGRSVRLWNPSTGEPVATLAKQKETIVDVWFIDGGRTLITTDPTSTTRSWRVGDGSQAGEPSHAGVIAVSGTGARMIVSADGGPGVLETATGETHLLEYDYGAFDFVPVVLALSADGALAAGVQGRTGWLWDGATGRRRHRLADPGPGQPTGLTFAPDGRTVLAALDQRVVQWRTDTGELQRTVCLARTYRTDSRYIGCR